MRGAGIVLVIAACGSPSKPQPVPPIVETAPPAPPASPSIPVEDRAGPVTPDTPRGAAATRDAELATRVTSFVDAFLDTGAVFTRDGKRVVFISTRDGLPQLYAAGFDGPATRIVTTTQRVGSVIAAPGGKDVVFLSDTGADENWSIFRVGLDGKNLIELTPGDKLDRGRIQIPDGRPSQIYFSARKLADAKSTIYATSATTPETPRALYTDDKPAHLEHVSPDGKVALVLRMPSRQVNYLLRVDLESGKAQTVYPPQGRDATIFAARLSRDGKRAYVATDDGVDQAQLLVLDLATGKQLAKHAFNPTYAYVDQLELAKEGGALVVSLTVGNRSEIRILDARTLAPRTTVALPSGHGTATAFSEDGKQLVAQWSTPAAPNELYAIDPRTGKATSRGEARPTMPTPPAIDATTVDIPAFDGKRIQANVYLPKGEQTKKHPVIVMFHGGPAGVSVMRWNAGTAFFLSLGYAVVEPNVRGSTGYGRIFEAADNGPKRLDALEDVETASRWVAVQPWADKDKLVVMGGSYGGYTTLIALARWPDIWRAGVDLFGVVDLRTALLTTSGLLRQIMLDEIGDPDRDADFLRSISPITDVAKISDPVFVFAGANDPRVPRSESDTIVRALRAQSSGVEYMVADNEGHSLSRRENIIAFYARAARFLESALRQDVIDSRARSRGIPSR